MTHEDTRHAAWRAEFEALGEEAVRMIDGGSQAAPDDRIRFARAWLKQREDSRTDAASARRDAREEETLSIARKALRNSKIANLIAIAAAIIVIIAVFIDKYFK